MPFPAKLTRETRLLADHLQAVPLGAETSYDNLTRLVGIDIRQQRHCLHAARRIALNETGACFDAVRGKGLRRLVAAEVPHLGAAVRKRIRLSARRTRHMMDKALQGFNDIAPEVRRQQLAEASVLGLTEIITRDRVARKIEQRDAPLPVADTARVLLRLLGLS